eukprot:SAG31_NODE_13726_length_851_cov_0.905585_1_plen_159_part_00
MLSDITVHSSPGMGILAHDCTNVWLQQVQNIPQTSGFPLAGNADAMHFASCRGEITIIDCVADRQGDDVLNIHSQYAVVVRVDEHFEAGKIVQRPYSGNEAGRTLRVQVAPHQNSDNTSWHDIFAQPVFRTNDTVIIRSRAVLISGSRGALTLKLILV